MSMIHIADLPKVRSLIQDLPKKAIPSEEDVSA